jgi:hypothetical protein
MTTKPYIKQILHLQSSCQCGNNIPEVPPPADTAFNHCCLTHCCLRCCDHTLLYVIRSAHRPPSNVVSVTGILHVGITSPSPGYPSS